MSFSLKAYLTGGAAERDDSLTGVDPDFMRQVDKLFNNLPDEARNKLKITSVYRSWIDQNEMYQKAVREGTVNKPGHQVAHPDRGRHVTGRAIDIANRAAPEAEAVLYANAPNFGFHRPVPGERWHFELTPRALEEAQREQAWQTGNLTGTPKFMSKILSDGRRTPTEVQSFDVFSPNEQYRAVRTTQPIAPPDMNFTSESEGAGLPSDHFRKSKEIGLFVYPERQEEDPYTPLDEPDDSAAEYARLPQPPTQGSARRSGRYELPPNALDQLGRAFSVLRWRNK